MYAKNHLYSCHQRLAFRARSTHLRGALDDLLTQGRKVTAIYTHFLFFFFFNFYHKAQNHKRGSISRAIFVFLFFPTLPAQFTSMDKNAFTSFKPMTKIGKELK